MKKLFTLLVLIGTSISSYAAIGWLGGLYVEPAPVMPNTQPRAYIKVYKAGTTDSGSPGAGITVQVYYGSVTAAGQPWNSQSQLDMTFNTDIGNDDEYMIVMPAPAAGYPAIEYTFRASDDGGLNWYWLGGANGFLPITLTKFTATPRSANENILAWTTATEKDNDYFAVQRSADGNKFDQIGRVQGAGTTATEQNYTFSDMAPLAGINYYRLAAVASNGDIDYSQVVTVNNKRKDLNSFAVVPNQVTDIASVKIDANKEMNMEIMLVDQVGRIITRSNYELVKGENTLNIDLSSLANGIYFLKAGEETTTLVKI